ncbi:MAG: hypothetical protein QGG88_10170 [Gammaproteobacteria bacterium]|nr:hypothetical protein [Gammaproteobacteria bacterium]
MEQASQKAVSQHTIQDWFVKHKIPDTTPIHAQQAWALAAQALRSIWPSHSQLITDTQEHWVTYFKQPYDVHHTLNKSRTIIRAFTCTIPSALRSRTAYHGHRFHQVYAEHSPNISVSYF